MTESDQSFNGNVSQETWSLVFENLKNLFLLTWYRNQSEEFFLLPVYGAIRSLLPLCINISSRGSGQDNNWASDNSCAIVALYLTIFLFKELYKDKQQVKFYNKNHNSRPIDI